MVSKKRLVAASVALITALTNVVSLASAAESERAAAPSEETSSSESESTANVRRKISNAPARHRGQDRYFQPIGLGYIEDGEVIPDGSSLVNIKDSNSREGETTIILRQPYTEEQLKSAVLFFDSDSDVVVKADGRKQISGETTVDLSDGEATFTVTPAEDSDNYDGGEKTYTVKVVNGTTDGGSLYVDEPEHRDIYFNSYYGNIYTVALYNIGDEPLTNISAELIGAKNVSFYTGDTTAEKIQPISSGAGAKLIKLMRPVASKNGDIKGTLKITADGQEPIEIDLRGFAGNPKVKARRLDNAVKYVPYSDYIEFERSFDWLKADVKVKGLDSIYKYDKETGEIYGCPQTAGVEEFTASVRYYIEDDPTEEICETQEAKYKFRIINNWNEDVYKASDKGYSIKQSLGTMNNKYDYVLEYEVPVGVTTTGLDFKNSVKTYTSRWYDLDEVTVSGTIPGAAYRVMDLDQNVLYEWVCSESSDLHVIGDKLELGEKYLVTVKDIPEDFDKSTITDANGIEIFGHWEKVNLGRVRTYVREDLFTEYIDDTNNTKTEFGEEIYGKYDYVYEFEIASNYNEPIDSEYGYIETSPTGTNTTDTGVRSMGASADDALDSMMIMGSGGDDSSSTGFSVYKNKYKHDPQIEVGYHIAVDSTFGEWLDAVAGVTDETMASYGDFSEFERVWLNGKELSEDEYEVEEGSTYITLKSETLVNNVVDGKNTLALEFRSDSTKDNELKVTAQNFRVKLGSSADTGSTDNDGGSEDSERSVRVDSDRSARSASEDTTADTPSTYAAAGTVTSPTVGSAASTTPSTTAVSDDNSGTGSGREFNYVLATITLVSSAIAFTSKNDVNKRRRRRRRK